MKLGFVSAILADRNLDEVLDFAAAEDFSCVELMCWPVGKADRRYAGVTHLEVTELSDGEAEEIKGKIAERDVHIPMLDVATISAGGGTIARVDAAHQPVVGPDSAGAYPGPACYRKGGPLTVTDCNLVLGRIDPAFFPNVFGPDGDAPLDPAAARARLEEMGLATGLDADILARAATMAQAMRAG